VDFSKVMTIDSRRLNAVCLAQFPTRAVQNGQLFPDSSDYKQVKSGQLKVLQIKVASKKVNFAK